MLQRKIDKKDSCQERGKDWGGEVEVTNQEKSENWEVSDWNKHQMKWQKCLWKWPYKMESQFIL